VHCRVCEYPLIKCWFFPHQIGWRIGRDGDPGRLSHPERGCHHRRVLVTRHQTHPRRNFKILGEKIDIQHSFPISFFTCMFACPSVYLSMSLSLHFVYNPLFLRLAFSSSLPHFLSFSIFLSYHHSALCSLSSLLAELGFLFLPFPVLLSFNFALSLSLSLSVCFFLRKLSYW